MGYLDNASGVVWCLSTPFNSPPIFQTSEFEPSSLRTTLLSLPSSLLQSTFNPLFPIPLFTFPTPLAPAHVYPPRPHVHHPLHPCPAHSPYRVPGGDSTSMGHEKGSLYRVLDSSAAASCCSVFDPALPRIRSREEVAALIGVWQMGESKNEIRKNLEFTR